MFDSGTSTASSTARSGAEVLAARKVACEEAEAGIVELASQIAAATARMLRQIVAMDRAGLIDSPDTMETWLAWRLSLPRRVAKDYVRVAYALEELPAISAAFGSGELSYDKVSSITRIATPRPRTICWSGQRAAPPPRSRRSSPPTSVRSRPRSWTRSTTATPGAS